MPDQITNHLPLVTRSEHHEMAISYACSTNGAWPYLPVDEYSGVIWQAHLDLERAGLIYRTGATDPQEARTTAPQRMLFLATDQGRIAYAQLLEMQARISDVQNVYSAEIAKLRAELIASGVTPAVG